MHSEFTLHNHDDMPCAGIVCTKVVAVSSKKRGEGSKVCDNNYKMTKNYKSK